MKSNLWIVKRERIAMHVITETSLNVKFSHCLYITRITLGPMASMGLGYTDFFSLDLHLVLSTSKKFLFFYGQSENQTTISMF